MNLNFVFKSPKHLRYENRKLVSSSNSSTARAIKVEPNINGCEGYNIRSGDGFIVTVYNLDHNHPVWNSNVQMTPKPMRIVVQTSEKIVLRGYQVKAISPFGWIDFNGADYGLSIHLKNGQIDNCVLHMHDRNIDIEYVKGEVIYSEKEYKIVSQKDSNSQESEFENFKNFTHKWDTEISFIEKLKIASKSDALNNKGAHALNDYDIINAIEYFNHALEIMPNNDDASKNLLICYSEIGDQTKIYAIEKKLNYLK